MEDVYTKMLYEDVLIICPLQLRLSDYPSGALPAYVDESSMRSSFMNSLKVG